MTRQYACRACGQLGHGKNSDLCPLKADRSDSWKAAQLHIAEGITMAAAGERFGVSRESVRQSKVKIQQAEQAAREVT